MRKARFLGVEGMGRSHQKKLRGGLEFARCVEEGGGMGRSCRKEFGGVGNFEDVLRNGGWGWAGPVGRLFTPPLIIIPCGVHTLTPTHRQAHNFHLCKCKDLHTLRPEAWWIKL